MLTIKASTFLTHCAQVIKPPPKRHTEEWAAQNIVFPITAPVPGPYDPTRTPYVIEIMRAFESPKYKMIVVVMGAQMGKTLTFTIIIGRRLDDDPTPIMYVGPDRVFVEDKFSPDIVGMLNASKSLRKKTLWGKKQKKTRFVINGAKLRLAWAGSASQLAGESAGLVLVDERDRMGKNVKGEGDPVRLARARLSAYANGKLGVISTPLEGMVEVETDPASGLRRFKVVDPEKLKGSPTWVLWQQGTRFEWAWPCPACKAYFIPRFEHLRYVGDRDPATADPTVAERTAHLECPRCECVIEDEAHKVGMNARGRFVAPGQSVDQDGNVIGDPPDLNVASLWVSGLASPFVTWGARANEYVTAVQSGDLNAVQTVINTGFGELYATRGEAPKFEVVLERRLPYQMGQIPYGVQRIALTCDVQKNGLYFVVRGWGARFESWMIRCGYIPGSTDQPEVWEQLETEIRAELAPGVGLNLVLIDSGYRPGDKWRRPENEIYAFCRRFNKLFCRPVKGRDTMSYGKHMVTSDGDIDHRGKPKKFRGLLLHHLNTDYYKTQIHERISRGAEIVGGWWLPEDTTDEYARQIVSETRVAEGGRSVWRANGANHYLDCEMMQWAAAELMQVHALRPLAPREEPAEAGKDDAAEIPLLEAQPAEVSAPPKIRPNQWLGNRRR